MQILETRSFSTDDGGRPATRSLMVDEQGHSVAALAAPTDQQRVRASVRVALAQRRIRPEHAGHWLDLGESDPVGCLDSLVALPARGPDESEVYAAFAAATGVTPASRSVVAEKDVGYAAYAGACGIPDPASLTGRAR